MIARGFAIINSDGLIHVVQNLQKQPNESPILAQANMANAV
jgi:hypothetical protein